MPFGSSQWMYASGGFYNGVATQSLRVNDNDSANLTRNPSSAGDRQTWVWSGWVKRSNLGTQGVLFLAYNNINNNENYFRLTFDNNDNLKVNRYFTNLRITTQVFRDVSAWYHIVCAIDTHQATANNRTLVYVNGEQITDFSTTDNYGQNDVTGVNHTGSHRIGGSSNEYFDGYMAEVNFIDGLSFFSDTSGTPNTSFNINSFGETKNGVWIPIEYTGSYGTNGFRLQFNQTGVGTASSSTIGADTSGNANHWTSSGIVASDCNMPDSPELNWCTLNSVAKSANVTLSEGNLGFSCSATNKGSSSTFGVSSGKWYWEVRSTSSTGGSSIVGIVGNTFTNENFFGSNSDGYGYSATALKYNNSVGSSYGATWTNGDIIGVALDLDAGTLTFYKNNSSQGTAYSSISGTFNPILSGQSGTNYVVNFGQDSSFAGGTTAQGNTDANDIGDFYYSPPSGYLALCTANLPEPTISPNQTTQADDYFNTVTYTGNGTGQSITGVGFQPDWTWIKRRSAVELHWLTDSIRGVTKGLFSDRSDAETTRTDQIQSFDTDGFTLGNDGAGFSNVIYNNYVSWNWKAGGTAVSNTDGTITSSVSANTDAGFSIVTYTGTGTSGTTIGHGLGTTPNIIVTKRRDSAGSWQLYSTAISTSTLPEVNGRLHLEGTNVALFDTYTLEIGNTTIEPTQLAATHTYWNANNGTYLMYCFADIEGFSKFGKYIGNSNADGTFVYTGFRPAFIMVKSITTTFNWVMFDNKRDTFNFLERRLHANETIAEVESNLQDFDFLSNGFKPRRNAGDWNATGSTYVYMAFAEQPFKYANAR